MSKRPGCDGHKANVRVNAVVQRSGPRLKRLFRYCWALAHISTLPGSGLLNLALTTEFLINYVMSTVCLINPHKTLVQVPDN